MIILIKSETFLVVFLLFFSSGSFLISEIMHNIHLHSRKSGPGLPFLSANFDNKRFFQTYINAAVFMFVAFGPGNIFSCFCPLKLKVIIASGNKHTTIPHVIKLKRSEWFSSFVFKFGVAFDIFCTCTVTSQYIVYIFLLVGIKSVGILLRLLLQFLSLQLNHILFHEKRYLKNSAPFDFFPE